MSGGMPLTHMTYCFINPLRWILGRVKSVCAVSNKVAQKGPSFISEENCATTLRFDKTFASVVGGFVTPPELPCWWAKIICTRGGVELFPEERRAQIYAANRSEPFSAAHMVSPFVRQASAFLAATESRAPCLNAPSEAKLDVSIAEAIVTSSRTDRFVKL
jgi:predicted dehydrogenase